MATHSSILVWKIPWTEESAGPNPWGHKESDTTELLTHTHTHTCVSARACVCTHTFMILFNTANLSSTEDAPIYVFTENV